MICLTCNHICHCNDTCQKDNGCGCNNCKHGSNNMFKKIILGIALASIIGWFFFITAGLLEKNSDKYCPENIFSKEDKGILLIRDLNELNHAEITQIISANELSSHLKHLQQHIDEKKTEIYISLNRNIVLLKNHKNWKKQDFESIISQISLAGVTSGLHGNYILLTKLLYFIYGS